jgi:phage terminase large subunit-like protein
VARREPDPATAYAKAVISGKITAGRLVRLACERHLRDLESGHERGLSFDVEAAAYAIGFIEQFLCLAEGEHDGKPFLLQPFQKFIVGSLFGWKGADGYRRFRTAYIEMGKGNGKSPLAAGIGILGLVADGEPGAEVYSAAVTRDQAKILFSDAEKMVASSPALRARIDNTVNNLAYMAAHSFFRPVSSEARALDGKRVHMALIDEVHEHPNGMVVDKMRAGTKGRRQALIFEITNSGYDRHSICFQHHEFSEKVLEGVIVNDSWFAYVCQLDPCESCRSAGKPSPSDGCKDCDDWRNEAVWAKANPNLDVSITRKYLREQVDEAIGMPGKQNIVKRLNFCIWTEQATRWLDMSVWDGGNLPVEEEDLRGCMAVGGLDLANTTDIAAMVLAFPCDDGCYDLVPRFWIPENAIAARVRKDRVPYDVWVREGLITVTPGDVIDYDRIREDIREIGEKFDIAEIAFDRWNATQLCTQLGSDGFAMVAFGQGMVSMAAPTKEFATLLQAKRVRHGGNPVLRWMASNVAVEQDAAGNMKPSKVRSKEKIDGIVATIMSIGLAMRQPEPEEQAYTDRGLLILG